MITPRFKLDQDENFLFVTIHAPFSRVSDADIYMDGSDFRFHSNPYYLRLNLPGDIVENDDAKAQFDANSNEFKIKCPKVNKGTQFSGLDMLTSLLEPKGKRNVDESTIEVLSDLIKDNAAPPSSKIEPEFDWFVEQQIDVDHQEQLLKKKALYGFGLKHSNVFSKLAEELRGIIDIDEPDTMTIEDRKTCRTEQEDTAFNPEHYLADLFQADNIDPILSYNMSEPVNQDYAWTEDEDEILKNLPNKEFLLDHDVLQSTYLGLVDILLAYAYEARTTMEDLTVESAWSITKLSGTLSWFEVFPSMQQMVLCFVRRSLCFPLYRNFKLCEQVIKDAVSILKGGRKSVLHCLLKIYHLFNKCDTRYILNQLYIRDYCVWIQKGNEEVIKSLGEGLAGVKLGKEDIGFDLPGLEEVGQRLMCETDSSDESDLEDRLAQLSLDNSNNKKSDLGAMSIDMRVAAEAAYMSSSDSELDSDDLSSAESD